MKIEMKLLQFGNLLKVNSELRSFADGELTLFAPLDDAMEEFRGRKGARFIANHMGKQYVVYF